MSSEYESDCTCEHPFTSGKLLQCGSKLCIAIQRKIPLLVNGFGFIADGDEYRQIPPHDTDEDTQK